MITCLKLRTCERGYFKLVSFFIFFLQADPARQRGRGEGGRSNLPEPRLVMGLKSYVSLRQ